MTKRISFPLAVEASYSASPDNISDRRAVPASAFRFFPVSKAVNNWRSDGPQLIEEQRPQSQPQKELW
jgi:putative SOS response-associated peptidase YedK